MEYTPNQLDGFKHEFAARRKRQLMVAISFVLVIIAFALLARFETDGEMGGVSLGFFFPIFFAVVIGALGFSFRNWRCPACGRYLGRELSPRFCSKCGVALQ